MSNSLASPSPWDLVAEEYVEFTTPFFQRFARAALERAGLPAATPVLDIAAGPGTLALLAAGQGYRVTAVDFAPRMLEQLRVLAVRSGLAVDTRVADGQALPFGDGSFAAAFSMFGLIFFPDRGKGFAEMLRVLVAGGVGCISSWQPMERFPLLSDAFAAIATLLPDFPFGRGRAPLGEADEIVNEMAAAGFTSVVVEEVSASAELQSLAEAWQFIRRGSAPFALLERRLGESAWQSLEHRLLAMLSEKYGVGPQTLTMVANLGLGRKPL